MTRNPDSKVLLRDYSDSIQPSPPYETISSHLALKIPPSQPIASPEGDNLVESLTPAAWKLTASTELCPREVYDNAPAARSTLTKPSGSAGRSRRRPMNAPQFDAEKPSQQNFDPVYTHMSRYGRLSPRSRERQLFRVGSKISWPAKLERERPACEKRPATPSSLAFAPVSEKRPPGPGPFAHEQQKR